LDKITYRAIIEHPTFEGEDKGRNLVEFSIDELVKVIVDAGDGWKINHVHECHPPFKNGDFKKVVDVTDVVKSTVQVERNELSLSKQYY